MPLSRVLGIVTLAAILAVAAPATSPAKAQSIEGGMPRDGEPSWADYVEPGRRRARQLRRDGLVRLLDARLPGTRSSAYADVAFDQALLRFERARRVMPADPDLLFFTAVALASWHGDPDGDGEEERRTDEAIVAFEELRALDPEFHTDRIAVELAILHARNGDHARSVDEYRRALAAAGPHVTPHHYLPTERELALAVLFQGIPLSAIHINLAESTMLLGDLETAVESYRRGAEQARDDDVPFDTALALWGLALALDRSGDHLEAMASARRAIGADPVPIDRPDLGIDHAAHGPMAILHSTDVFFEPAFEVHAYDAVGWEGLGRQASVSSDRDELLRRAMRAWRTYLTEGGNASRFAAHASAAAERLELELTR